VLEEIRIRGLGVIEDALLELGPGFTVVTGETGAGKTMVVTGLGLLFGGRADAGAVRPGTRAVIEGRLRVDPGGAVAARALEAGAELDGDGLLVARTVAPEGRSRAHLGGRSVPVGLLAELAEDLVAVHGQADQQRLLRPARQRDSLDRYAGAELASVAATYAAAFARLRAVEATRRDILTGARERAREADLLRFGLDEVDRVGPQPGEDDALRAEDARLAHADALRIAAATAHAALSGDPGDTGDASGQLNALSLLALARRALDPVRGHDDDLATLADRVLELDLLVADLGADLAAYAADVDTDPARLALVAERRAQLTVLTRKYGATIDEVLAWAADAERRLLELDGDDSRGEQLDAERTALRSELGGLAARLSALRRTAAQRFSAEVSSELAHLAMPHAEVLFEVRQSGAEGPEALAVEGRLCAFGPHGVDEVELLLRPHSGAPVRPVARGASGGELSRVMLAIEVVFAGADPVPTFVFDEVDAGVGGRAAVEVGRRLAALARTAQVLVVTHLPQVAAYADRHLVVVKTTDGVHGGITRSGVRALDHQGRIGELARMLAGQEDSGTARAHAEELLATALAGWPG
jgi:DNA repair protein RecN (Recombination protein N)